MKTGFVSLLAVACLGSATLAQATLSPQERARLQSDEFRRRLLESYIADTDVEPPVSQKERQVLQDILPLIADGSDETKPGHQEKLEQAAKLLRENATEKASAVFDFLLGNVYNQRQEYDLAAIAYTKATDKHVKFRRAWGNLGEIRYRRGEFREAADAFGHMIELGGANAVVFGLLGSCHSKAEEFVAAESAFRMAAMLDPKSRDWKLGLAESFFRQKRFADAVALFDQLIAMAPEQASYWVLQGEAYAMLDQPMKAAENFEMADRLGGSTRASLDNLGDIYANQQLFDLAVSGYLRALQKAPDGSLRRPLRAARFMVVNGALAEARALVGGIEAARAQSLADEDKKELLKIRARIAMAEDAGEEEAAILEQIVGIDPLDGDALIQLGQYHGRSGDNERAVYCFERAAGLENHEADARLRHGELLVRQGKYAEALPLLRRAVALKPNDNVERFVAQVERAAQTSK